MILPAHFDIGTALKKGKKVLPKVKSKLWSSPYLRKKTFLMHSKSPPSVPSLATLRDLPALIDHYVDIVDRVLFLHGFDEVTCEFPPVYHELDIKLGRRRVRSEIDYSMEECLVAV